MQDQFLQPTFVGPRFEEHTLPLDVATDLVAYETLVIDLAKHLYLKANPDRQRVSKGFDSDFHLHLVRVDSGSARPVLSIVVAGVLAMGTPFSPYFSEARDLIAECIAAPDGQLPEAFPKNLLHHFNQIGRSLRDGEHVELSTGTTQAILTPSKRKTLVLSAEKVYERVQEFVGMVEEIDWHRHTFRLKPVEGAKIDAPMENYEKNLRLVAGRIRHQVCIEGVCEYDSWDRLKKVTSVQSLEVYLNVQLSERFEQLKSLVDGWLDGEGRALDQTKLDVVSDHFVSLYPESLPLPAIVPTSEGNLLFEWDTPALPSVDLDLANNRAEFHAFQKDNSDATAVFGLSTRDDWNQFFAFLSKTIDL